MSNTNLSSLFSLKGDYPFLMKSQPKYRWWKPILAALLAGVLFGIFSCIVFFAIYIISGEDQQVMAAVLPNATTDGAYLSGDQNNPFVLLVTFLTIAVGIPSVGIAMRVCGLGGLKTLSSTEGKLRWKRFLSYIPLTFCVALVVFVIDLAISVMMGDTLGECTIVPITLLVILIFCPLQCAAEEYAFRGFVFQGFSSWIPVVVIPFIIQAVLFSMAHGYNIIGLVGVGFMGLCAAWLTVKTGGLEAAISMHAINNVISFGTSSLFVAQATQSNVTAFGLVADLILIIAMTVTLYLISKRKGYIEEKRPVAEPVAAPVQE